MDRRKHFSLLVVRGDGTRVLQLNLRRRLSLVILAGLTVLVIGLTALASDWWSTRSLRQDVDGLVREIDTQRAIIGRFNRRLADLQKEIASWRELHVRIWEPFGPEAEPNGKKTGIGGARIVDEGGVDPAQRVQSPPSEELDRLAETVLQEGESLRALERLISRAGKALAALPSRWPVRGVVNSEFGNRQSPWTQGGEFHGGIDIAAERGTRVNAPAAGTVAFAGPHAEYGLTVMVDHDENLRTIYSHLSKLRVTTGQKIARGDELGLTGNTGRSSGPHLHYEILVKNRPVNPRAYLWD